MTLFNGRLETNMSNYNFDFAMTAKISPAVVKEMITKMVEEQTGKKVASIEFEVTSRSVGYMRDEHLETFFDGVTVYFQSNQI